MLQTIHKGVYTPRDIASNIILSYWDITNHITKGCTPPVIESNITLSTLGYYEPYHGGGVTPRDMGVVSFSPLWNIMNHITECCTPLAIWRIISLSPEILQAISPSLPQDIRNHITGSCIPPVIWGVISPSLPQRYYKPYHRVVCPPRYEK